MGSVFRSIRDQAGGINTAPVTRAHRLHINKRAAWHGKDNMVEKSKVLQSDGAFATPRPGDVGIKVTNSNAKMQASAHHVQSGNCPTSAQTPVVSGWRGRLMGGLKPAASL